MTNAAPKSDELIPAVDAGTQPVRAALVDLAATFTTPVKTQIEPYFSAKAGFRGRAETDPEYYWRNLCDTCKKMLAAVGPLRDRIVAVTLATQRSDLCQRGPGRQPAAAGDRLDGPAQGRRHQGPARRRRARAQGAGNLSALSNTQPNIAGPPGSTRTSPRSGERPISSPSSPASATHRFTGEFKDSVGNVIGTIPFDVKKSNWAGKLDPKWLIFPLEQDKLLELIPPTESLGQRRPRGPRSKPVSPPASPSSPRPTTRPATSSAPASPLPRLPRLHQPRHHRHHQHPGTGKIRRAADHAAALSVGDPRTVLFRGVGGAGTADGELVRRGVRPAGTSPGARIGNRAGRTTGKAPTGAARLDGLRSASLTGRRGRNLGRCQGRGHRLLSNGPHPGPPLSRHCRGDGLCPPRGRGTGRRKGTRSSITQIRATGGGSKSDSIVQITADAFGLPVHRLHTNETFGRRRGHRRRRGHEVFSGLRKRRPGHAPAWETSSSSIRENREIYPELLPEGLQKNVSPTGCRCSGDISRLSPGIRRKTSPPIRFLPVRPRGSA
ncbi:MAG: FGGY-family carbohydrate kinase [Desulfosudis oleivorans]|nr:FGGY-family carbohydrate kinase [Desulfosudis oleivorans]